MADLHSSAPPPEWISSLSTPLVTSFSWFKVHDTQYTPWSLNTFTLKSTLILWTPSAGTFCFELLPLERVLRMFKVPAFSCLLTGGGFSYGDRRWIKNKSTPCLPSLLQQIIMQMTNLNRSGKHVSNTSILEKQTSNLQENFFFHWSILLARMYLYP